MQAMEPRLASAACPWPITTVLAHARVVYGRAKPKGAGAIPAVGSGGIYGWVDRSLVDYATLVIGRKGTAGRVWKLDVPFWPSDTTFYLDWKNNDLDLNFLNFYFQHCPLSGEHSKTTIPSLTVGDLERFEVPLPSLPEQRAIANVLMAVQRAKETTEKVIAATKELKKSLMRHLFTYGPVPVQDAPNVKLKTTEIGDIPEHWSLLRVRDFASVKGGKRLPKGHSFANNVTKWPYLRVTDMVNGTIRKSGLKYLSETDAQTLGRYTISANDVYISIAGTIGNTGIVPKDLDGAYLTENAAKIVLNTDQISAQFLHHYLTTEASKNAITVRVIGGAQPKLALVRIADLPIPAPPNKEQVEIETHLFACDLTLQNEQSRHAALDSLFQSLLHNLMTGQVRVPPFDQELPCR
jgi:type I restriction enzyme, S subunit